MANLSKHPLLMQAYDVIQAIEECGASTKLTDAVTKAGALLDAIDKALAGGVLSLEQEPKYDVSYGKLVNRATGIAIPGDEPIMIFRAHDIHVRPTVLRYCDLVANESNVDAHHRSVCFERYQAFVRFAEQHPERMKKPDTAR